MVYQGSEDLIENHGGWYMEMQSLGYNYRMPDILCALGISQLERAKDGIKRRREIAKRYDAAFKGSKVTCHIPEDIIGHAYHLYVVEVDKRKKLYDSLRENGIYAQIHYIPLHTMPYYRNLEVESISFPVAETYYGGCISLPMYPSLTNAEQDYVIEKVIEFAK